VQLDFCSLGSPDGGGERLRRGHVECTQVSSRSTIALVTIRIDIVGVSASAKVLSSGVANAVLGTGR
jgi:hypothetical protein